MITKSLFLLTCGIFFIVCVSLIYLIVRDIINRYELKKCVNEIAEILQNINANEHQ